MELEGRKPLGSHACPTAKVRGLVLGTTGGSPRVQDHREWERLRGVMREAGLKSVNSRAPVKTAGDRKPGGANTTLWVENERNNFKTLWSFKGQNNKKRQQRWGHSRSEGRTEGSITFTSAFLRKKKTNAWSPLRCTMQDTLSLRDSLETRDYSLKFG